MHTLLDSADLHEQRTAIIAHELARYRVEGHGFLEKMNFQKLTLLLFFLLHWAAYRSAKELDLL